MTRSVLGFALALVAARIAAAQPVFDRALAIDVEHDGSGAALLAAHMPATQQDATARVFETLLANYRAITAKAGIAADEPAGAVAMFVVGNLAACRHAPVSDASYVAVVRQLRSLFAAHPELVMTLHLDRAAVIEQIEIIGMLMMVAQAGERAANNASAVARTGAHYLLDYLGLDAADLELGDRGLEFRSGKPAGLFAVDNQAKPTIDPSTIEAVVLQTRTKAGYNGFIELVPEPVVLFKSGETATGKHWRRTGTTFEILDGKRWSRASAPLPPMPAHAQLAGRFEHESYSGSPSTVSAASWRTLVFDKAGRFTTDRGGGVSGANHASSQQSATIGGTYELSGYTLTLRHDDGRIDTAPIIFSKQRDMFWLDGVAYLAR